MFKASKEVWDLGEMIFCSGLGTPKLVGREGAGGFLNAAESRAPGVLGLCAQQRTGTEQNLKTNQVAWAILGQEG